MIINIYNHFQIEYIRPPKKGLSMPSQTAGPHEGDLTGEKNLIS